MTSLLTSASAVLNEGMYASWIWGNRIVPYAGPGLKAEGYGNPKRRADRTRRFIDLCGGRVDFWFSNMSLLKLKFQKFLDSKMVTKTFSFVAFFLQLF